MDIEGSVKLLGRETKHHLHGGPRIRSGGAVPPFSLMPSSNESGHLYGVEGFIDVQLLCFA